MKRQAEQREEFEGEIRPYTEEEIFQEYSDEAMARMGVSQGRRPHVDDMAGGADSDEDYEYYANGGFFN